MRDSRAFRQDRFLTGTASYVWWCFYFLFRFFLCIALSLVCLFFGSPSLFTRSTHNLLTYWFDFLCHLLLSNLSLSTRTRLIFGQKKHFLFTPYFLDIHEHRNHTSTVAISFFLFPLPFLPQNAALSHLLTLQGCAHFSHIRHQIISDRARRSIISAKPHRLQIFLLRPVTATFKKKQPHKTHF